MSAAGPTSLGSSAAALGSQLVAWRRELHRHPELGFEEHRTAAFVAERLAEMGLEVRAQVAGTGVLALLRAPGPRAGRGVLLRADMDALPIQEVGGREYGSTVPGRMHACGHDGHMSMLLGAARLLVEHRHELTRDVVFCFQPGEEGHGGAERMIQAGALDWVDVGSAFALHLWSPHAAGTVHVREGAIMAAADEFAARIVGRPGHGAQPHAALDPIVAAAQCVVALQSIVSRSIDPLDAAVVTVGSLHAGSAPNVIPGEAELCGTLRSFSEAVRERLRTRVREVLESTAQAAGCRAEVELTPGYPATVNDARAVRAVRAQASEIVGAGNVIDTPPLTAAEDFAYFLRERPGAFVLVGAGSPARGIAAPHHAPDFDIDESVLPHGAELLARLALSPPPADPRGA